MKQHTHVASCENSDSQTSSLWLDMIESKTCECGGLKQCECGLGQTATNPVSEVFRSQYNANRVGGVSTCISVCQTKSVARYTEVRLWCVARKTGLFSRDCNARFSLSRQTQDMREKQRPRKTELRNKCCCGNGRCMNKRKCCGAGSLGLKIWNRVFPVDSPESFFTRKYFPFSSSKDVSFLLFRLA